MPTALRRALLAWFDRVRRPLAWRRSRDPYRVWVAEVMLQQTRVAVVEPAYRRFVRAFPTMARLAAAGEDEVLSLWSGLGYYGRARALHRAARKLHDDRRGFPSDLDSALALPGVGQYTAAAVLSIAYGQPHAAVDGNVERVLSRLRRLRRPDGKAAMQRSLAESLLDRARPGDWNQALMELGETICLPKTPLCGHCPISRWCEAHGHGEVDRYPTPKPRRRPEKIALAMTVVRDPDGRVLLEKGAFPHLRHMWLPLVGVGLGASSEAAPRARFRHAILHREFTVAVHSCTVSGATIRRLVAAANGSERRLFSDPDLRAVGRSALLTKALAHA